MSGFCGTPEETMQQNTPHTPLNVFLVNNFVTLLADK